MEKIKNLSSVKWQGCVIEDLKQLNAIKGGNTSIAVDTTSTKNSTYSGGSGGGSFDNGQDGCCENIEEAY